MSDDFERLRAIVYSDETLQDDLMRETESAAFVARVAKLAVRHDLVIAEGELWSAIEDGRALWYELWTP